MLAKNSSKTNAGKAKSCQPGAKLYHAIMPARIKKVTRKSAKATTIVAVGTMSRGKYTLLIRLTLAIKLLEASLRPVEKNVHGSIPANTISA